MSPTAKCGHLMKRNTSLLHSIVPCCFKHWKSRFCIVVGNYMYRFSGHPDGTLKGIPVPLDACTIRQLREGDLTSGTLGAGDNIGACFELSMIRKVYTFRCSSTAESLEWVSMLKQRKAQAIRESLGHAPLSAEIKKLNTRSAAKMTKRIQRDAEEGEAMRKSFQSASTSFNPMGGMSMGE